MTGYFREGQIVIKAKELFLDSGAGTVSRAPHSHPHHFKNGKPFDPTPTYIGIGIIAVALLILFMLPRRGKSKAPLKNSLENKKSKKKRKLF